MFRRDLQIFVGTIVFFYIFLHPLSLFAPANTTFFDLQSRPQLALQTQPMFLQNNILSETKLPKPEPSSQTPLRKETNQGALPQQVAVATPAGTPEDAPISEAPATPPQTSPKGNIVENSYPPAAPASFYRLDVQNMVALTFDDGPSYQMTEQYLAVLETYGLQATFFVVGRQAVLYPEILEKIVAQGSELGSHSWKHDRLDRLSPKQIAADLQKTAAKIYEAGGQEIAFMRPPYGRGSANVLATAKDLGQKLVYWDVDPRDWEEPSPKKIVSEVLAQVRPGSIILLHEGYRNTLTALPEIIQGLQARGLQPVSVSALLAAWNENVATDTADIDEQ
ncbi:MAG: polysaccharide deacetylase family protein [Dethiobacteria bacterium]|jgi:peptidoglycan/xylan/chitin deacetylase (PgdA/CDA1 family)